MADKVIEILRESNELFDRFNEVFDMTELPITSFVVDHIGCKFETTTQWEQHKKAFENWMSTPRDVVNISVVNERLIALAYMEAPHRYTELAVHTVELMQPKKEPAERYGFCVIKLYPVGSLTHTELARQLAEGSALQTKNRDDGMIDVLMGDGFTIRCSSDTVWNTVREELPIA